MASKGWITPEELAEKKSRQKRILVISVPFIAVALGILCTLATSNL
ncbi:hypothetical protein AB3Z07_28565 (plasmid) [Metabacillus halosaccharovorans]|nr:hypothetical protein [Metabacillus halosaccharovorans]MCM3441475.1 hypothetical protein [Metabacillus halosaccharovorans]